MLVGGFFLLSTVFLTLPDALIHLMYEAVSFTNECDRRPRRETDGAYDARISLTNRESKKAPNGVFFSSHLIFFNQERAPR